MTTTRQDRRRWQWLGLAVELRLAIMVLAIPIAGYLTLLRLGALLHVPFLIRLPIAYKAMDRLGDELNLRPARGARP